MKKMMSIAAVALIIAGSTTFAGDAAECTAKKAECKKADSSACAADKAGAECDKKADAKKCSAGCDKKADAQKSSGTILIHNNVKLLIDPMSEMFLIGTTIDYQTSDYDNNIFEDKFLFIPNKDIATSCGCGISFTPKN